MESAFDGIAVSDRTREPAKARDVFFGILWTGGCDLARWPSKMPFRM